MIIRIDIIFAVYFENFYTGVPEFMSEVIAAAKVRKTSAASGWCWQLSR